MLYSYNMKTKSSFFISVTLGISVFVIIFASCSLSNSQDSSRLTKVNQELSLVDINDTTTYSTAPKGVRATAKAKPDVPGGATITLIAEVEPPTTSSGETLQASHIYLTPDGKTAFVSYMLQGDSTAGALDVFDVASPDNPQLLFSSLFDTAENAFDIAVVHADANTVYLAGQKIDQTGKGNSAYVVSVPYSKKDGLNIAALKSVSLPGYFATDIALTEHDLFVTTGAYSATQPNVGLYVLDPSTLEIKNKVTTGYPDLRSVAYQSSDIAVFEAQSASPVATARIDIYKNSDISAAPVSVDLKDYPPDAEAKSKIAYYKDTLFAAANRSGVVIVDAKNGKIQGCVPAPALDTAIVELKDQTSNAVSSGNTGKKDLIYIANGEAGLWVGDAAGLEAQTTSSTENIAGTIRFGAHESVNYVAAKNATVICASGLGGIKILTIVAK